MILAAAALSIAALAADPPLITNTTDVNTYVVHYEVQIIPRDDIQRNPAGGLQYQRSQFVLDKADVFFPVIDDTGSSETNPALTEAQFWWRSELWEDAFTMLPRVNGAGRYGKLEFLADPAARNAVQTPIDRRDASNMARLIFKVTVRCKETVFDERRALDIPWPADYPPELRAWTEPDQHYIHARHPAVVALMNDWTNANPRAMTPVELAKTIAGRAIEHVRTSAPNIGNNTRGQVEGLDVQGAAFAAETGEGSVFDLVCLYVAACRAAGLPTRLVVGIDVEATNKTRFPQFHAWAEFALLDPADNKLEWIPVDVVRQREFGSRPPPIQHRWEYFGNNRFLDTTVPVAFHFHPPDRAVGARGIIAYGSPALWGWISDPAYAALDQQLNIMVQGAPIRGGN